MLMKCLKPQENELIFDSSYLIDTTIKKDPFDEPKELNRANNARNKTEAAVI
jgi:hypothetical protein